MQRKFDTRFVELAEGATVSPGPLRVTPFGVIHACGAPPCALRLELDGRTVAHSGDTEWTERLIPAVAGADLLVSERCLHEKAVRYHLDYATLLRHRSELGCKRLVVTHRSPDVLARAAELPVEAAYDGLELSL